MRLRPIPWAGPHLHLRLAAWWLLATGWIALGFNSQAVPWGTHVLWVIVCCWVAGTAIGFVTRRTKASLNLYLLSATAIGMVRGLAYLYDGSGGPAAVWFVVAWTNLLLYLGHDEWDVPSAR